MSFVAFTVLYTLTIGGFTITSRTPRLSVLLRFDNTGREHVGRRLAMYSNIGDGELMVEPEGRRESGIYIERTLLPTPHCIFSVIYHETPFLGHRFPIKLI